MVAEVNDGRELVIALANAGREIESLRTALAIERERAEKAEKARALWKIEAERLNEGIEALEEEVYAARNLLTLFLCIDFDRFTEHDEALLDSVTEDSRRLLASPLTSEEPQR